MNNIQFKSERIPAVKNTTRVLPYHEDLTELCTSTVSIKDLRYKPYDVVFIMMKRTS